MVAHRGPVPCPTVAAEGRFPSARAWRSAGIFVIGVVVVVLVLAQVTLPGPRPVRVLAAAAVVAVAAYLLTFVAWPRGRAVTPDDDHDESTEEWLEHWLGPRE